MSCSCHINPPCDFFVSSYECASCGETKHEDDSPSHMDRNDDTICDECNEELRLAEAAVPPHITPEGYE